MSEQWGPWIDHEGSDCPCAGMYVAVRFRGWPDPRSCVYRGNPECDRAEVWIWPHDGGADDIVAYRIRKPRALLDLIGLVEALPQPSELEPV